jgi:Skp family chaperone for outer membrane proteins
MSKGFFDNNKDTDSEAEIARRQNFIARMERKLEFKKSALNPHYQEDRYLIR